MGHFFVIIGSGESTMNAEQLPVQDPSSLKVVPSLSSAAHLKWFENNRGYT